MPWGGAGRQNIEPPHTLEILSTFFNFCCYKCILVLLARHSSGELRCSVTALILMSNNFCIYTWQVDNVTLLLMHQVYLVNFFSFFPMPWKIQRSKLRTVWISYDLWPKTCKASIFLLIDLRENFGIISRGQNKNIEKLRLVKKTKKKTSNLLPKIQVKLIHFFPKIWRIDNIKKLKSKIAILTSRRG